MAKNKQNKNSKKINKKKNLIYNLLLVICVVILCFSGYKLYSIYSTYKKIENENKEINLLVVSDPFKDTRADINDINTLPEVDIQALKAINSDVIGYIYIPSTSIGYPILYGETNDTYIKTNIYNEYSSAGSLFVDYRNKSDFSDTNTVIYGHHMKNGSMFGNLSDFQDNQYVSEHPYIFIYTEKAIYKYQIFSSYVDDAMSSIYTMTFTSQSDILSYLSEIKNKSVLSIDVDLKASDKIITLSTCTNITDTGRYITQAKLVEVRTLGE